MLIVSPNLIDVKFVVRPNACIFESPAAGLIIEVLKLSPIIETNSGRTIGRTSSYSPALTKIEIGLVIEGADAPVKALI